MKKWVLSKKDSSDVIERIQDCLGVTLALSKSAQASCVEPEEGVVFVTLDGYEFIQKGETYVPFLGSPGALGLFPAAVVDQGAIKFVVNGADVMRPGIRKFDDWGDAGKTVVVKEEGKGRAIAVGSSLVTSEEAKGLSKGGCFKNVHHVGDRYWELHKTV